MKYVAPEVVVPSVSKYVDNLRFVIKQMLAKGTPLRKLYDQAFMIFRFFDSECGAVKPIGDRDVWVHVGYGNLTLGCTIFIWFYSIYIT